MNTTPMNATQLFQPPIQAPQPITSLAPPRPAQVSPARALLGIIMPVLAAFAVTLDLQMTNAGLKDIQGALGFSADEATWIAIAYTSAQLVMMPLAGWLAGTFSYRRYLTVNAVVFVGLALGCASAWDLPSLLVLRGLQGLVAGGFTVSAFTLVITKMPRFKQHLGLVMVGITTSLPIPLGQFLAGWAVDQFHWQMIYYLSAMLGSLLIPALWHWLDPEPVKLALLKQIDWLGWGMLAIAIPTLITVLYRGNTENWWDSPLMVQLSLMTLLFWGLFGWIELHHRNSLLNLRLLGQRNFGLINLLNLGVAFVLAYGAILPQYLGQIQGYNTLQIGGVLIWAALVNPLVTKLVEYVEARWVMAIGLAIFVVSCWMNITLTNDYGGGQFVWSQIVRAMGQPVLVVAIAYIATSNVPKGQAESVSALFNLIRGFAGALSTAMVSTLLTHREQFHSSRLMEAIDPANGQTQMRLQQLNQAFVSKLGDPVAAQTQAIAAVAQTVRREAFIMAYGDCFYFIGMGLFLSGGIILLLRKTRKPAETLK